MSQVDVSLTKKRVFQRLTFRCLALGKGVPLRNMLRQTSRLSHIRDIAATFHAKITQHLRVPAPITVFISRVVAPCEAHDTRLQATTSALKAGLYAGAHISWRMADPTGMSEELPCAVICIANRPVFCLIVAA